MNRDEIRKVIEEEITRQELADYAQEPPSLVDRIRDASRHPITLTLVGFLLTSIVGSMVSQSIADRSQRDSERSAALEAVQTFASAAAELRVQQGVFEAALRRDVGNKELAILKTNYEKSFVRWNSERYKSYLSIRSFFGFTYSNFAEQLISRTVHQDFRAVNSCLIGGYDWVLTGPVELESNRNSAVTDYLDACLARFDRPGVEKESGGYINAFERRQEEIFQCSRQIFDPLHHYISRDYNCAHTNWQANGDEPAVIEKIYDSVWIECGVGEKIAFNDFGTQADAFCTIEEDAWWPL